MGYTKNIKKYVECLFFSYSRFNNRKILKTFIEEKPTVKLCVRYVLCHMYMLMNSLNVSFIEVIMAYFQTVQQ